jgi:hypothetical protein
VKSAHGVAAAEGFRRCRIDPDDVCRAEPGDFIRIVPICCAMQARKELGGRGRRNERAVGLTSNERQRDVLLARARDAAVSASREQVAGESF